ncbi:MAG TPA: trypsin-like peptidase domain-containing protein [Streptosporangiaceae bacterium]|jgi:S1-C subfamily serine protease
MDSSWTSCARARSRAWLLPGAALAAAAALASCGSSGGTSGSTGSGSGTAQSPLSTNSAAAGLQAQYQQVVRTVLPSVVQISTSNSTGSGVVYDSKGDIVTNAHVVGGSRTVQVRPATSSKSLQARVIGSFDPDDLAVIRVDKDAGALKPAAFADSQQARIGEIVLAMGNPLGLTDSVTQGIVSATGRTVSGAGESGSGAALIAAAIQTSADINPGNSGGALVNLGGQVLGIPTLAAREPNGGGAAPGIGFAIPSNTVKKIAGQLITSGRVTDSGRASLGISAQTVVNDQGQPGGVAVVAVVSGGPAAKAGLRAGDVIIGIGSQGTPSLAALEGNLASRRPGDDVTVHIVRNGRQHQVSLVLGSLPG